MKQPFFTFPRALAMQAIMTLCIGLGCAYPLLAAMGIPIAFSHAAALCAAITAFLSAFRCLPRLQFLSYPLLLAALAMLLRPYFSQAASIGAALTLMVNGQPLALAAYAQPITYIVCVVLTSIGSGLADDDHAFFPLVLLTLGMLFAASFLGVNIGASSILPLLLALLLAARASGVSPLRSSPIPRPPRPSFGNWHSACVSASTIISSSRIPARRSRSTPPAGSRWAQVSWAAPSIRRMIP